jgi:ParB family chromosome partitioning protein
MTKATPKITLSPSRDIPFNKLTLSQSNVRRVKAGVSIEQLAESIAQRTLLQSLSVRAVVDAQGNETGMFEVPAGGRRYRALELLVKQKRMAKTQPVPCVVRDQGSALDDSLAENDERVGLHPLDQFRAFQALRDDGMSDEDIAARHFVSPAVVKQRLRLASVSPKLCDVYAEDGVTLEQLMAFSVTSDHARHGMTPGKRGCRRTTRTSGMLSQFSMAPRRRIFLLTARRMRSMRLTNRPTVPIKDASRHMAFGSGSIRPT